MRAVKYAQKIAKIETFMVSYSTTKKQWIRMAHAWWAAMHLFMVFSQITLQFSSMTTGNKTLWRV